ncbi:MAG: DUF2062 domain-containing protein [Candidatus Coatesbacteria bacterium]|nr:DUF2062 domain-containing protein [Candidatus Coatesbacteria bacterium]
MGCRRGKRLKGRTIWRRARRWLRLQYLRFLRSDSSPHKAALGLAVGVFIGIFPTFGLGALMAVGLAFLFRFSKVAAVVGSAIMNPITSPFFWGLSLTIGAWLTGNEVAAVARLIDEGELWSAAGEVVWTYLAGNTLLALALAGLFYGLGYGAVRAYQEARRRRMLESLPDPPRRAP